MEKKQLKDYLHLHLGCEIRMLNKATAEWSSPKRLTSNVLNQMLMYDGGVNFDYQLLLRPLSDMTEEERVDVYCVSPYSKHRSMVSSATFNETGGKYQPNIISINWSGKVGSMTASYGAGNDLLYLNKLDAEQTRYLLSKSFDLFGLIEAGLAIDSTTLKPTHQ